VPGKFLSREEPKTLLEETRRRAEAAVAKKHRIAVRDYFIVDLALSTGLRVMEIAQLNCGNLFIGNSNPCLLVRNGKGGRKRVVKFSKSFERHCFEYLTWKETVGGRTTADTPLLTSSITGGLLTTRAMQKAFKRSAPLDAVYIPNHHMACKRSWVRIPLAPLVCPIGSLTTAVVVLALSANKCRRGRFDKEKSAKMVLFPHGNLV
jgi:site-specific recombinase XerD